MRRMGLLVMVGVLLGVLVRGVDGQGVGDSPLESPIDPIIRIHSGDPVPTGGGAVENVPAMVLPEAGGDWILGIGDWILRWIVCSLQTVARR